MEVFESEERPSEAPFGACLVEVPESFLEEGGRVCNVRGRVGQKMLFRDSEREKMGAQTTGYEWQTAGDQGVEEAVGDVIGDGCHKVEFVGSPFPPAFIRGFF